jgi:hypothetical protein
MTKCTVPPDGWECTRGLGHDGPCAAFPIDETMSDTIRKGLWEMHTRLLQIGEKEQADALSKALLASLPPIKTPPS